MDPATSPIIVCGAARSGTTFVWELLNQHPDITLSDEYFVYKTPSIISWFGEMGKAFNSYVGRGDWPERKERIIRLLWYCVSEAERAESGLGSRRWGNKTPGSEIYIDFYEKVFERNPPLWVYCLRNPRSVFLSTRNMPWAQHARIRGQIRRYKESVQAMEKFRAVHPDRLYLFQIDRIEPDLRARIRAASGLLEFVGESLCDEMMPFVESWRKVLSTKEVRSEDLDRVMTELPAADLDQLASDPEINRIMHTYGYADGPDGFSPAGPAVRSTEA